MQIKFSSLIRINLGFPSEWTGVCVNGEAIKIWYRYGRLKIFHNDKIYIETQKDEFDINGYLSDDDLYMILKREKLIAEDEKK